MSGVEAGASTVDAETYVDLHELAVRQEGDEYIVGRIAGGDFVALPEVGARVIELLQAGCRVGEAEAAVSRGDEPDLDVEEFVLQLVDLGFVAAINGHPIPTDDPRPTLPRLQAHHVSWLFGRAAHAVWFALVGAAAVALVSQGSLLPTYTDFFWSGWTSAVLAVNASIIIVSAAFHEFAHLAAARSLGIPARVEFGTRLNDLVVQTDVTALWAVDRRSRYRVYLAGLRSDLALIAAVVLLRAYAPVSAGVRDLLDATILLLVVSIVRQFFFYMRTDIYFVVLDLLRCGNLFGDALDLLRYRRAQLFERLRRRADRIHASDPRDRLPQRERRAVGLYAGLVLVGTTLALAVFAVYALPIFVTLMGRALIALFGGAADGELLSVVDGAVVLAIQGGFTFLFVRTFLRTHPRVARALSTRRA